MASAPEAKRSDKDKEKGVNVQVVIRCRPLTAAERAEGPPALHCTKREVSVHQKGINKVYSFDAVYGPEASQVCFLISYTSELRFNFTHTSLCYCFLLPRDL